MAELSSSRTHDPQVPSYWHSFSDNDDGETDSAWKAHLEREGFVVLKAVATPTDVADVKDLLFQDIENEFGIDRNDPSSWHRWRLPSTGLVASLAQSKGQWHLRGLPRVQNAFRRFWGVNDVITSMDACIIWRPWYAGAKALPWRPRSSTTPSSTPTTTPSGFPPPQSEGLHLDQNPFSKPQLDCVQGMVPLLPVTPTYGGLQVVPRSHTADGRAALLEKHPELEERWAGAGDWCPLPPSGRSKKALLLEAEPGDLILWDSRVVHGGRVGLGTTPPAPPPTTTTTTTTITTTTTTTTTTTSNPPPSLESSTSAAAAAEASDPAATPAPAGSKELTELTELARMACTVAMTPRAWASDAVQRQRRDGFDAGISFNHCPHEAGTSSGTIHASRKESHAAFELNDAQRAVL